MKILRQLRRARIERGETQASLAQRIGVSRSMISMLETGAAAPTIEVARAWLDAYDLPATLRDADRSFHIIARRLA